MEVRPAGRLSADRHVTGSGGLEVRVRSRGVLRDTFEIDGERFRILRSTQKSLRSRRRLELRTERDRRVASAITLPDDPFSMKLYCADGVVLMLMGRDGLEVYLRRHRGDDVYRRRDSHGHVHNPLVIGGPTKLPDLEELSRPVRVFAAIAALELPAMGGQVSISVG